MTVNQRTILDNQKITTIKIGRMSRSSGKKLADKLNGKTYMDFEIIVAPAGGDCVISAQTSYDGDEEEILGMLLFTMANELVR